MSNVVKRKAITPRTRPRLAITLPNGRPLFQVTQAQLRQIEKAVGYGLTQRMIADVVLGIAESTWHELKGRDVRVSEALERGRAKAAMQIGKALFKKALNGDLNAIRWYEMTRLGIMPGMSVGDYDEEDRVRLEREIRDMTPDQAFERIKAILELGRQRRLADIEAKKLGMAGS